MASRMGPEPKPLSERLWAKVQKTETCWLWTGTPTYQGYGRIRLGGVGSSMGSVHRVAYELLVGPVPDGLVLDHLCRTPLCVNPGHLEAVTQRENSMRGFSPCSINATKTHCPRGHAYDKTNTYVDNRGWRQCKACAIAARRQRRAVNRADRVAGKGSLA